MISVLISTMIIILSIPAIGVAAGEPSGFGEFPWGATREQMTERFVKDRCASSLALDGLQDKRIVCYGYQLETIGPVTLKLEFVDGILEGYVITAPGHRASELKATARAQLGAPTLVSEVGGESLGWEWSSGTIAVFTRRCLTSDEACLLVNTRRAVDPSWKEFLPGSSRRARKGL